MNAQTFQKAVAAYIRYRPYTEPECDRFDLERVLQLCAILAGPETKEQKIIKIKSWAADPVQPWYETKQGEKKIAHQAEREQVLRYIEEQLQEVKYAS
ncbi:MAG TPA: hypothetical protein VLK22_00375 [Candidatus Udaeobacter sp.]|nr:hypothetical protein [Candidatus Udaeobacter sp.]